MAEATLRRLTLDVPDFPKPGIVFKDITPVLEDPAALKEIIDAIAAHWSTEGITRVVGIESRGFIFGAALAYAMDLGLTLVRKPGKLPREAHSVSYELEYGTDTLQMHVDAVGPGDRVLIVDDVLATGGTAAAVCALVEETGATVAGLAFALELGFLPGRDKLPAGTTVQSLMIV
ncbi:MAG: adenine phosphoribosyltransferase [Myxococcota bacterium]|nr:adenine phosphoribosyltransferase [Myxococcota bacterium]